MPLRRSLIPVLALVLAGCGAGQSTSAAEFEGEEKRVAQVVDDLQAAAAAKEAGEICSRILAPDLVDQLAAPGRSCVQEVDKALADADNFLLEVQDVALSGATATVRVEDGDNKTRSLRLAKQGEDWKISALG